MTKKRINQVNFRDRENSKKKNIKSYKKKMFKFIGNNFKRQ